MSQLKKMVLAMASVGLLVTAAPAFSQSQSSVTDSGSVPPKQTREDRLEKQGRMNQKAKRQTADVSKTVPSDSGGGPASADTRRDRLVRQGKDANTKPDRTPKPNPSIQKGE